MWFFRRPLGAAGERAAAKFLARSGVRLVARNFRCTMGEIDLIGLDRDTLVFFEVKTRRTADAADPEANIGPGKQRHMLWVAREWLAKHHYPETSYRFDAISIVWPERGRPEIRWIVDAFVPKS